MVAPLDDVGTARERTGGGKGAVGGGRDPQRHVARVVGGALRAEEEVPVALPQGQWATGRLDGVGPQLGPEPPGLRRPGEHHREDGLLVVTAVPGHQLDGPVGVVGEGALQEQQPVLRPARQLAGGLHGPVADQQIAPGAGGERELTPFVAARFRRGRTAPIAARRNGPRHIDGCPAAVRSDQMQAVRDSGRLRLRPRVGDRCQRDRGGEAPPARRRRHGAFVDGRREVEGGTGGTVGETDAERLLAETVADHATDHHGGGPVARVARPVRLEPGVDPLRVHHQLAALEDGHDAVIAVRPVHGRRRRGHVGGDVGAAQHPVSGDADFEAPGEPLGVTVGGDPEPGRVDDRLEAGPVVVVQALPGTDGGLRLVDRTQPQRHHMPAPGPQPAGPELAVPRVGGQVADVRVPLEVQLAALPVRLAQPGGEGQVPVADP